MLKFSIKRAAIATKSFSSSFSSSSSCDAPQHERVARQMIQYALGHARSQRSGESYAQAMMILEQGLSNAAEDVMGLFQLAMSTLLYERGEVAGAIEKLQIVRQMEQASPAVKGSFRGRI